MTALSIRFKALFYALKHSIFIYRHEVNRLRDGLPF